MDSQSVPYGRRLLPHVVDERAAAGHPRPFASIPNTNNAADGYHDISYVTFANAINRLSAWLTATLGSPKREFESFVYIAPADLRYHILCLAAAKVGYVPFLVSPRNSAEAFASLLTESGADKLLVDEAPSPAASTILKCRALQRSVIPSLKSLLDDTPVSHIPFDAAWEDYQFRPFLQIHSSGSTGIPKLITLSYGGFAAFDAFQMLDREVLKRLGSQGLCVSFPPFHVAGLLYSLAAPCWFDSTLVLPPPVPLTADVINEIHVQADVGYSALAPSIVTDLANNPVYLENLAKIKGVGFAGGPLPEATGKLVVTKTVLHAGYGASEWMVAPLLPKGPEDWAYFCFNEEQGGLEFRERDEGLYEMCIVRKPGFNKPPVFFNFPEIDEFCTKDLFSPHPSKAGLWRYVSRMDDIIVFSNGEKLNPVTFEGLVSSSPLVKGCVVVGQGRFQAALLIEPKDSAEEKDLLDRIWPTVQKANEPTVKHGRVARDHIFFTSPDKPLPRAGKGTIQRAAANKLYATEIDNLYTQVQNGAHAKQAKPRDHPISFENLEATKVSLSRYLREELDLDILKDTSDLFSYGLDSLQLINLVRTINASRPEDPVDAKLIYDNASIEKLSRVLQQEDYARRYDYNNDSDDEELKSSWLAMDDMYRDMTEKMTPRDQERRRRRRRGRPSQWLRSEDAGPVVQPDGSTIAWLQVLSMFLVNVNNWGLVSSFGVFQYYYQSTLLSDHSASSIAWIGTLQGALLLIVGVVAGPLFDMGYFRTTLVAGSVGLVFAVMMLSLATEYYQVMLAQGVLLGICEGLLYIPGVALVPVYFKKNRGLALGLSTGGGSIGGVIYPAIFYRLLQSVGFGWAVRIVGFIALTTLGIAIVLTKPLGPRSSRQLIDKASFKDPAYMTFLGAAFLLLAGMFVPIFLTTTFATTALHTSSSLGFSLISILNAAQFFGRVLPAWSADFKHRYLGPEILQLVSLLVLGILGFAWNGVHNLGGYIPWIILYGFFSGFGLTLPAVVLPYICPNGAVYGTRIGILYACAGVGFLISTPIATAINESLGAKGDGFLGSQMWTGTMCVVAAGFFAFTAWEARGRRILYEMGKRERKLFRRKRRSR